MTDFDQTSKVLPHPGTGHGKLNNGELFEARELSFLPGVFIAFLCAVFGANAVAIKISLSGLGPFTAAALRFTIASIAIFFWARVTGRSFHIHRQQVCPLLFLSGLFVIQISLLNLGLSKTNASRVSLLSNLQPFWILFLAHFFIPGDRITAGRVVGLLMAFAGVAFVLFEKEGVTEDIQLGDLLIITTTILGAINIIYTKRVIHAFTPSVMVLYLMVFSLPFFYLEALLWDGTLIRSLNPRVLTALLYQALVAASFGFVTWNNMLRKYAAVSMNAFNFIMPVTGVFLSGLLLAEPITSKIYLALIFIVAGIFVVQYRPKKDSVLAQWWRHT